MAKIWILAFFMVSSGISAMTLQVGRSKEMMFPEGVRLKVSRKGVIELEKTAPEQWVVYPLRSGVVTITQILNGQEIKKEMIRVTKSLGKTGGIFDDHWQGFICKQDKVICGFDDQSIKGESDSWPWFYTVKKRCQGKPPCDFAVTLSEKAQRALSVKLERLYGGTVKVDESGHIWLRNRCDLAQKGFEKLWYSHIVQSCPQKPNVYRLLSKIYWLRKGQGESLSLKPWGVLEGNLLRPQDPHLSSHSSQMEKKVVGEPELLFTLGKEAKLRQGFDSLLLSDDKDPVVLKGGLEITIRASELQAGQIKSVVSVLIRLPSEGGQRYEAANIESQVWFELGKSYIVAKLDAKSRVVNEEKTMLLAHIPIISPLFRSSQQSESEVQLFVELKVEKSDSHEMELHL